MSAMEWPVIIEDADSDKIRVRPGHDFVVVAIMTNISVAAVALTPAQSAILRAALEAAEKGMS